MASSVWSGYLTFGLISMPVRLFSGARSSNISFHMLHRPDHVRIPAHPQDGVLCAVHVRHGVYGKCPLAVVPSPSVDIRNATFKEKAGAVMWGDLAKMRFSCRC